MERATTTPSLTMKNNTTFSELKDSLDKAGKKAVILSKTVFIATTLYVIPGGAKPTEHYKGETEELRKAAFDEVVRSIRQEYASTANLPAKTIRHIVNWRDSGQNLTIDRLNQIDSMIEEEKTASKTLSEVAQPFNEEYGPALVQNTLSASNWGDSEEQTLKSPEKSNRLKTTPQRLFSLKRSGSISKKERSSRSLTEMKLRSKLRANHANLAAQALYSDSISKIFASREDLDRAIDEHGDFLMSGAFLKTIPSEPLKLALALYLIAHVIERMSISGKEKQTFSINHIHFCLKLLGMAGNFGEFGSILMTKANLLNDLCRHLIKTKKPDIGDKPLYKIALIAAEALAKLKEVAQSPDRFDSASSGSSVNEGNADTVAKVDDALGVTVSDDFKTICWGQLSSCLSGNKKRNPSSGKTQESSLAQKPSLTKEETSPLTLTSDWSPAPRTPAQKPQRSTRSNSIGSPIRLNQLTKTSSLGKSQWRPTRSISKRLFSSPSKKQPSKLDNDAPQLMDVAQINLDEHVFALNQGHLLFYPILSCTTDESLLKAKSTAEEKRKAKAAETEVESESFQQEAEVFRKLREKRKAEESIIKPDAPSKKPDPTQRSGGLISSGSSPSLGRDMRSGEEEGTGAQTEVRFGQQNNESSSDGKYPATFHLTSFKTDDSGSSPPPQEKRQPSWDDD